jgi:hypothetical protein
VSTSRWPRPKALAATRLTQVLKRGGPTQLSVSMVKTLGATAIQSDEALRTPQPVSSDCIAVAVLQL